MYRRGLLGGLGSAALSATALAEPCGEQERRKLLKFSDWIMPEAQACGTPAVGPAATGDITADFAAAQNYPNGGSGQTVVSQRLWGGSNGSAGDSNFGMMANATTTAAAAKINWGLFYFKNSGQQYWKSDLSIDNTVIANLVNNFYLWDPLGISAIVVGADFNQSPFTNTVAKYGTAMANLAAALANATMPNGKKLPIIAMTAQDEPNGNGITPLFPYSTVVSYYNDMIPKIKGAVPGMMIWGPQTSFLDGNYNNFATDCNNAIDIYSWDAFWTSSNPSTTDTSFTNAETGSNFAIASRLTGSNRKAFAWGGYSIYDDTVTVQSGADSSYPMALAAATWAINAVNNASLPVWMAKWTTVADTINSFEGSLDVIDASGHICPVGWFQAQAVRKIFGRRWQVTTSLNGFKTLATTPSAGHASMMLVNFGGGAVTKTVAFSHSPDGTGNTAANVWQLGTQSQTYTATDPATISTLSFTNGVSAPISFPDPSITIVSI